MNDQPGYSFCLSIRSTSPPPVSKKQPPSFVGGKKKFNNVNKERNKIRKGSGIVSKKDNKKNLQNQIQHQVRLMKFLLQILN